MLGSFPSNAPSLGTGLWEGGAHLVASHLLLLHSTHWLGQGRVCPGWHLGELRGNQERGYPEAGHGAGQERELGQQTRPHCAAPGPLARPSIAPLCSAAAPAAFPAGTAPREHRGRRSEVAVVLGVRGERRRVREEGRVPGLFHHGLAGCCWVPWNAVLPGATSFGGKMPKMGSRRAQGGQLDTSVLTSPPSPSHQTLPVPKVAMAVLLWPGAGTSKWAARG